MISETRLEQMSITDIIKILNENRLKLIRYTTAALMQFMCWELIYYWHLVPGAKYVATQDQLLFIIFINATDRKTAEKYMRRYANFMNAVLPIIRYNDSHTYLQHKERQQHTLFTIT